MLMMIQIYLMPETGVYETAKPTPSSMDDPSAHVLEYRSYWFSMSVVFTLKYILVWSIFVYSGSEKYINSALNMVDFYIFS